MKKTIYCKHCCGEIKSKADLVIASSLFAVYPYHEECYSKEMKTINSLFMNTPINSNFATYTMLIMTIPLLIVAFFMPNPYKFIIILSTIIGLGVRAYSWIAYERYLE